MHLPQTYRHAYEATRGFLATYRAHLSAGAMAAGFITDNLLLGSVDTPLTQAILAFYIALAAIAVTLLHVAESGNETSFLGRWRNLFPMAIQFALGSVLSGLLVFYTRSAAFAASWPFLVLFAGIFIGNELFHHYVARLVFSTTLLFFVLFSFAILIVPVYLHAIGTWVFVLSGVFALLLFFGFLRGLLSVGAERFRRVRWQILLGALAVFALINTAYFTSILPPLPLAMIDSGIFHAIKREGSVFTASAEVVPWYRRWFFTPTLNLAQGEPAYVFSSVFAPIKLSARVRHRWEYYSPIHHAWTPVSTVSFTVNGGRRGGYRGYTIKKNPMAGDWRVDIETEDGRLIGRVRFTIVRPESPPVLQPIELR